MAPARRGCPPGAGATGRACRSAGGGVQRCAGDAIGRPIFRRALQCVIYGRSMTTPAAEYLEKCRGLMTSVQSQLPLIEQAADWFSQTILADRMVHVFGSGHS